MKHAAIQPATETEFAELFALGQSTPEFKVSAVNDFMERDEFLSVIKNPQCTFLFARIDGEIVGFVCANRQDIECGQKTAWACLVYLVVKAGYRGNGIAQQLHDACITDLKSHGITKVYGWANTEGDSGIVSFMEKQGFAKGHTYVWMDKDI